MTLAHLTPLCQTMDGHGNAVICLVVANRLMYTGSADGGAKSWVTEFGDCTRDYKGHKHTVGCMRFHKGLRESFHTNQMIIIFQHTDISHKQHGNFKFEK